MEIYTPVIGYGAGLYDLMADNTDEILHNVSLGEINKVANNHVNSNLENGKKDDLTRTNALDMALLRALIVEAQLKYAHEMMMHIDPVCQLSDKDIKNITSRASIQKQKHIAETHLGKTLYPRQ
jgi:hypothetical protein